MIYIIFQMSIKQNKLQTKKLLSSIKLNKQFVLPSQQKSIKNIEDKKQANKNDIKLIEKTKQQKLTQEKQLKIQQQIEKLNKKLQQTNNNVKQTQKLLDIDLFLKKQKQMRKEYAKKLNEQFDIQKKKRQKYLYKQYNRGQKQVSQRSSKDNNLGLSSNNFDKNKNKTQNNENKNNSKIQKKTKNIQDTSKNHQQTKNQKLSNEEQDQGLKTILGYDILMGQQINRGQMMSIIQETVDQFDFSNFGLGSEGILAILQPLFALPKISKLNFAGNQINDQTLTYICYYIDKTNRTELKQLDLSNNPISKQGIKALKGLKKILQNIQIKGIKL